ncbi:hypothetical protein [Rhizobium halophilum]|uniref:hypothetical protein n=1 Tax=Rhizobium halophilum TaxID=2846852 RepID=UPI001EFE2D56|nr:hypothetical protein [Rhizobium halophilum]MCF6371049.1 hypothetical protein [Rhizobium halophilum]
MSTSDIGHTLHFIAGAPATFDEAGYEALFSGAAIKVGGIVSIGPVSGTNNIIDVPDLESGWNMGAKGAKTGSVTAVALREIKSDAGQAAVKAAAQEGEHNIYSFKIVEPGASGEVEYITGIAYDWQRNERSTTSYAGFTFSIRANYDSVVADAPA